MYNVHVRPMYLLEYYISLFKMNCEHKFQFQGWTWPPCCCECPCRTPHLPSESGWGLFFLQLKFEEKIKNHSSSQELLSTLTFEGFDLKLLEILSVASAFGFDNSINSLQHVGSCSHFEQHVESSSTRPPEQGAEKRLFKIHSWTVNIFMESFNRY